MLRLIRRVTSSLAALMVALGATGAAAPASAEPALWRVADADSEVWIFGSVHILPADLDWRRPELAAALAAVDIVYFEAPVDLLAQMRLASLIRERGIYLDGHSLRDDLSAKGLAALTRVAAELGQPIERYLPMKPWLAFTTLTFEAATASGGDPDAGVDAQLMVEAARAGKEFRHFETLEQQTLIFADLPMAEQVALLEAALAEQETDPDALATMIDAWAAGDLDRLERAVVEGAEQMPAGFEARLFTDRNRAWAAELDAFLRGAGDALVVVGAGHLVGEADLLDLLTERGWRVERF